VCSRADGKVCLSLLGTWHGGDAASKWSPASSSLFQILLSIQGMIFVEVRGGWWGVRSEFRGGRARPGTAAVTAMTVWRHTAACAIVHALTGMCDGTLVPRCGHVLLSCLVLPPPPPPTKQDPYFNEPNVEVMRGTPEGNTTSMRYNAELRLATLRWAVLAHLKKPPPGLQEVVAAHFRALRGVLASRAGRWLREAAASDASSTSFSRLVDVMDDIMAAAAAL
jgi:hypothetical protein